MLALLRALATVALAGPVWALADCGAPATPISQVQGSGPESPLVGKQVTVEAVVTFDARGPGGWQGVYLQQPDHQQDDDPATSEALFVYRLQGELEPGQKVRVSGTVKEFHGLTELTNARLEADCGPTPMPAAVVLDRLWPVATPPEALENMRVRLAVPLTVIDSHHLARYGELTLAPDRQWIPTQRMPPGPEAHRRFQTQERQRLTLDDGSGIRGPEPVPYPPGGLTMASAEAVRAGARVTNLEGVLDFRFGQWRLQPSMIPRFDPANPRPAAPEPPAAGHLRVASFNLGNYFNGDGQGGGFKSSRGAGDDTELAAQTARLESAIDRLRADILAVMEVENDGYGPDSALADLTRALGPPWRYVSSDSQPGRDAIRVGLLYRGDRIEPVGPARVQPPPWHGRPALAQDFRRPGEAVSVQVVAVHFKSKGCRNASGADRDQDDGQGCFAHTRKLAAEVLADWLEQGSDRPGRLGTLIAGDLNSYARETPLKVLARAGYADLVRSRQGETAYTYQFRGGAGTLDYLLADQALGDLSTGARTWAINADEPAALAYDRLHPPAPGVPWRSSDHDPLFTDLRLAP